MLQWIALCALIAAAGTWLARRYALWRRLIDEPGERRSHVVATPRGGGIGVVLALAIAVPTLALRFPAQAAPLALFGTGFVLVALIGWIDDHRPLSPWLRLAVHGVAAALLGLAFVGSAPIGVAPALLFLMVAFAALVLVNAWNFMDGIDGIAASQAMIAATTLAVLAGAAWGWLGLAIAGACLGFLPFNAPRARIFMGDVGSGALGYALAAVTAAAACRLAERSWLVLLPLSAFLVDTGLTLVRRVLRGEQWWAAHTQHAYQAAARRWGHPVVTLAFAAWSLAWSLLGLVLASLNNVFMIITTVACYTSAVLTWTWLQAARQPSASDAT